MLGALAQNFCGRFAPEAWQSGKPTSTTMVKAGGRAGQISLACRSFQRRPQRGKTSPTKQHGTFYSMRQPKTGTIICGDAATLISTLRDRSVSLCLTSPPYAEQRKRQYRGVPEKDCPAWMVAVMEALRTAVGTSATSAAFLP
jgi:hypothetical protein